MSRSTLKTVKIKLKLCNFQRHRQRQDMTVTSKIAARLHFYNTRVILMVAGLVRGLRISGRGYFRGRGDFRGSFFRGACPLVLMI